MSTQNPDTTPVKCIEIFRTKKYRLSCARLGLPGSVVSALDTYVAENAEEGKLYYQQKELVLRTLRWNDLYTVLYLSALGSSEVYLLDVTTDPPPTSPPAKPGIISRLLEKIWINIVIEAGKKLIDLIDTLCINTSVETAEFAMLRRLTNRSTGPIAFGIATLHARLAGYIDSTPSSARVTVGSNARVSRCVVRIASLSHSVISSNVRPPYNDSPTDVLDVDQWPNNQNAWHPQRSDGSRNAAAVIRRSDPVSSNVRLPRNDGSTAYL